MIRFSPDSLLEAVLRPFIMAVPKSWLYTEILAPDFRFLILLVLSVFFIAGLFFWGGRTAQFRRIVALLVVTMLAFVPWLFTGGNGRYFMPFLLIVGPLCVSIVYSIRASNSMRVAVLALIFCVQGVAVSVNSPWRSFDSLEWIRWQSADAFQIEFDSIALGRDATYVSFTDQSFSIINHLFPASSRWINLTAFDGSDFFKQDRVLNQAREVLSSAKALRMIMQSQPRQANPETGVPTSSAVKTMNQHLANYGLRIINPEKCLLLPSNAMSNLTLVSSEDTSEEQVRLKQQSGFWVCPLLYTGESYKRVEFNKALRVGAAAIERVERQCPRLFPPGQYTFGGGVDGLSRRYTASDSSLTYDHASGAVYVKFMRALNSEKIGSAADILAEKSNVDCRAFVSRDGLPWGRGI